MLTYGGGMTRTLTAALGALSLSLLLAGCITVNVPPVSGPGPVGTPGNDDDKRVAVSCTEKTVTLNEPGVNYVVTGDCDEVIIEGRDVEARIEKADSLVIRGDDNDVDIAELDSVLINGQGNDVEVTNTATLATVEVSGNENDVSANGSIGGVVINGNENDIEHNGSLDSLSDNGNGNTTGSN